MPANPEQIHAALKAISRGIPEQSRKDKSAQAEALRQLRTLAPQPQRLAAAVEEAVGTSDASLRCALPFRENIAVGYSITAADEHPTILAIDGSQALPDRHEEVLFGLINIGAVTMQAGSGEAPRVDVDTRVIFGNDLYPQDGPLLSDGEIALLRDAAERASLLRHASQASRIDIALTDGPLELWGAKEVPDPRAFERALSEYLDVLRELQRLECIVAGYVDKPAADLVVRLLEVAAAAPDALKRLKNYHPLRGTSDTWLFGQILRAGERSAVFALQSVSRNRYIEGLSLHFFYLNVGAPRHPTVARVEIPNWVAQSKASVDSLHQALLQQTNMLGAKPYPYILHRAHETARISRDEQEQIKLRILLELRNNGAEPGETSGKASAKHVSEIKGRF
jgi:hypothetical protein